MDFLVCKLIDEPTLIRRSLESLIPPPLLSFRPGSSKIISYRSQSNYTYIWNKERFVPFVAGGLRSQAFHKIMKKIGKFTLTLVTLLSAPVVLTHQSRATQLANINRLLHQKGLLKNLYLTEQLWIVGGNDLFEKVQQMQSNSWILTPVKKQTTQGHPPIVIIVYDSERPIRLRDVTKPWISEFPLLGLRVSQYHLGTLHQSLRKELLHIQVQHKDRNWVQEIFHLDGEHTKVAQLIYDHDTYTIYQSVKDKIKWIPHPIDPK